MRLFYDQQGLFADEVPYPAPNSPTSAGPGRRREAPGSPSRSAAFPRHRLESQVPPPSIDDIAFSTESGAASTARNIRSLQRRRDELQWRLETGALRAENEALEGQVLHCQEDFRSLEEEFKDMKDRFGEQLGDLDRKLEGQQSVTSAAQKRVICMEDLIRFFEEQRRLMAGHWKEQCRLKDERIRTLNMKLTEYTIDYKLMKQTEASLSHELQCLQDRHGQLRSEHLKRRQERDQLEEKVAEAQKVDAKELSEAEAVESGQASPHSRVAELEACGAGLREQLQLLEEWQRSREAEAQQQPTPTNWNHECIWRHELDVREGQLEKITSQLDRTNHALLAAQAALTAQRARHEEMKSEHRKAEEELREGERARTRWRRECMELKRAEADLRRTAEQLSNFASPFGVSDTGPPAVAYSFDPNTGDVLSSSCDRQAGLSGWSGPQTAIIGARQRPSPLHPATTQGGQAVHPSTGVRSFGSSLGPRATPMAPTWSVERHFT